MKSITTDWSNEKWEMIGAQLMEQKERERLENCTHGNQNLDSCDECECYPDQVADENYPMMNYAYPLHSEPGSDDIITVCKETNCTVVQDNETGDFYLALTGGGMDLSQDIAYAYIICDGCIDWDMLTDISLQIGLSASKKQMKVILEQLDKQIDSRIDTYKSHLVRVKANLKEVTETLEKEKKGIEK